MIATGPLTIGCQLRYWCGRIWEIFSRMSDNSADKIHHLGAKVRYFVRTGSLCWTLRPILCVDEFGLTLRSTLCVDQRHIRKIRKILKVT